MSYVFDVSSEHNDLGEVDYWVRYKGHGDYKGCNRTDNRGNLIYNVEFFDKRYALMFKTMFNSTTIVWDEHDNREIVTEQELRDRGYVEVKVTIDANQSLEFQKWCDERNYAVVDEFKVFSNNQEPMTVWIPSQDHYKQLVDTWSVV